MFFCRVKKVNVFQFFYSKHFFSTIDPDSTEYTVGISLNSQAKIDENIANYFLKT